ncbi:MAG TPA: CBS domain-containing protein [Hyphomicrobiaceae bacterium]|nr:CBS domain-containing protein [Hyphomicrobiaceae bacterium]
MTNRELRFIVKDQDPLLLSGEDTVAEACHSMWKRGAGSVLVVDAGQRLTGIFTGRDAVRLLARGKGAGRTHLAKVMTPDPVTVSPKSRAVDALRAMIEGGFRHVPVTDGGRVLGVVSRSDLKGMELEEFLRRHATGWSDLSRSGTARGIAQMIESRKLQCMAGHETVQQACRVMCECGCGSVLVVEGSKLQGVFTGRDAVRALAGVTEPSGIELAAAMTPNPISISPDRPAIEALRTMNDGGFRHLPVVEEGRLIGVVSRNDFTGLELDRLDEEEHLKEVLW